MSNRLPKQQLIIYFIWFILLFLCVFHVLFYVLELLLIVFQIFIYVICIVWFLFMYVEQRSFQFSLFLLYHLIYVHTHICNTYLGPIVAVAVFPERDSSAVSRW